MSNQPIGRIGAARAVADLAEGTVICLSTSAPGTTRVTLRHAGFESSEVCGNTAAGWESSFEQLALFLSAERSPART